MFVLWKLSTLKLKVIHFSFIEIAHFSAPESWFHANFFHSRWLFSMNRIKCQELSHFHGPNCFVAFSFFVLHSFTQHLSMLPNKIQPKNEWVLEISIWRKKVQRKKNELIFMIRYLTVVNMRIQREIMTATTLPYNESQRLNNLKNAMWIVLFWFQLD